MEIKEILRNLVSWKNSLIIILTIFIVSIFSALIPPFQSPDEFAHVKRAYLLGKGQFILDTPGRNLYGGNSGGDIDTALLKYTQLYNHLPFRPDGKVSSEISISAKKIKWSGVRVFNPAPATGNYFSLAYAPQAVGLVAGEFFGLTVETSYRLARFLALVSSVIVLSIAFSIFPTNPLTVASLIIPMSVFQFASASLDAFVTSLCVFAISVFLAAATRRLNDSVWPVYALGISVFIVVTSRTHLLALLALQFYLYFSSKEKKHLFSAVIVSFATLAWLFVAITFHHNYQRAAQVPLLPVLDALKFYLLNPSFFVKALIGTIGSRELLAYYLASFIGILGWLDTVFSETFYKLTSCILFLAAICAVSFNKSDLRERLLLLGVALISVFLIFFLLALVWNPVPATVIEGVQGRYFLLPLILISYALAGTTASSKSVLKKISIMLLVTLAVATIWSMPEVLIHRYFAAK